MSPRLSALRLKSWQATSAVALAFASLGLGGCGASDPSTGPSEPAERVHNPLCVAPAGVSNAPQSIAETLRLLDALPKPLTIPCFLESLARPLSIHATFGILSAQPAVGARSPRIFLFFGPNTMSIAPEGDGATVLEFGEERPDYRSLKAELAFPITLPQVPAAAPFDKTAFNDTVSTCGLCHAAESREPNAPSLHAFVSQALRPLPRNQVTSAALSYELGICDPKVEPERCAILDGLLGWGPVSDAQFPEAMATFN